MRLVHPDSSIRSSIHSKGCCPLHPHTLSGIPHSKQGMRRVPPTTVPMNEEKTAALFSSQILPILGKWKKLVYLSQVL